MTNTRNPVGWFEIYVAEMPRAKAFYETVFQTTLVSLTSPLGDGPTLEMWQFPGEMMAPGCSGTLCQMEGCAPGGGGTLIYFSCADCSVEEGRVVAAGGQVFTSDGKALTLTASPRREIKDGAVPLLLQTFGDGCHGALSASVSKLSAPMLATLNDAGLVGFSQPKPGLKLVKAK